MCPRRSRSPPKLTIGEGVIRLTTLTIALTLIATPVSGAASVPSESADSRAQGSAARVTAPVKCPTARGAVRFYSRRFNEHRERMGAPALRLPASGSTGCPRYLSRVLKRKAYAWRLRAERWHEARTLRDFEVLPGNHAWHHAVQEVQRAYPGTEAWLMSCSASEGGWGRWVPNSQGSGVGGWMQMFPSTFWRMFGAARADVQARGFRVPASAASWYSPLGQALGGAWAIQNGRRHEWVGHGC